MKSGKPVGRPTKYKPEYCKMLLDYFLTDHTRQVITQHANKKGDTWETCEEKANPIPTIEGFCVMVGINKPMLHEWCKTFKDFQDAYTRAKLAFSNRVQDLAGRGFLNPAFSIFLAKNTMDWTDKQQIEHKGSMEHSHFFEGMLQRAQEIGHEETRAIEGTAKRLPEPITEGDA